MAYCCMLNCRSVSPTTWEHARQALVFYFSRRHGLSTAEDLAHETLVNILSREDYQFEKEEDFLRVCYGFANHVLQTARREAAKRAENSLVSDVAAAGAETQGLTDAEINVFLDEVLRLGRHQLREIDWQLIQQSTALDGDRSTAAVDPAKANSARVKLHRARRKLALLTGWRKG